MLVEHIRSNEIPTGT